MDRMWPSYGLFLLRIRLHPNMWVPWNHCLGRRLRHYFISWKNIETWYTDIFPGFFWNSTFIWQDVLYRKKGQISHIQSISILLKFYSQNSSIEINNCIVWLQKFYYNLLFFKINILAFFVKYMKSMMHLPHWNTVYLCLLMGYILLLL